MLILKKINKEMIKILNSITFLISAKKIAKLATDVLLINESFPTCQKLMTLSDKN